MAINLLKKRLLDSDCFQNEVGKLYRDGALDEQAERYASLIDYHTQKHSGDVRMFSSPGRIEVIGNHTDHNNGKVLCAAVTIDTLAAVTKRDDGIVTVDSIGFPTVTVNLNELDADANEFGTSEALVRGVLAGMKKRGYKIGGFDASTTTNVFKGAGVSSSAAFEVLVVEIVNAFYNDCRMDKMEKAIVAQYAENVYFGKPSGLMDQSAIALGGVSYIDFKDLSHPEVNSLQWDFDDVDIVIVNCGGDHCNLTPNYAAIRAEMEGVAKFFGKKVLREVKEDDLYSALPRLKTEMSGRAILRAMHFYDENRRVEQLSKALQDKDENTAMSIISASGESSYKLLQNCYPEGDSTQPIPLALAIAKKEDGVRACRVHGGGFAGTVLVVVDKQKIRNFVNKMAALYGSDSIFVLGIRADGAIEVQI